MLKLNMAWFFFLVSGRSCVVGGRFALDGTKWTEDCNPCYCNKGVVTCTKVWGRSCCCFVIFNVYFTLSHSFYIISLRQLWCGPKPCRLHGSGRAECPLGQLCVPVREDQCFVKPCSSQGECWSAHRPAVRARCHPESDCANVTFTFRDTMPQVRT